jgi:hypothetical protein
MSGNPYHEPAGSPIGGRFARKPGGVDVVVDAAREAAGLPDNEQLREEKYRQFWNESQELAKLRGSEVLPYERAWTVGPDGEKIAEAGEAIGNTSMSFSLDEIESMRNNYLIHNHPVEVSFSSKDIAFGVKHGLSGIVVAEKFGLHTLDYDIPDIAMLQDISLDLVNAREMFMEEMFVDYQKKRDSGVSLGESWPDLSYHNTTVEVMKSLDVHSTLGDYIEYEYIPW